MKASISRLLEHYENGKITRRNLIGGIAALAARTATSAAAPPRSSALQGENINHVALRVTNVARSRDFYSKLLGLPVVRESSKMCFLGLGRNFLALFGSSEAKVDHYCIGVKKYEVKKVTAELRSQGLNPRQPGGTDLVYFHDPDGFEVQLDWAGHQPCGQDQIDPPCLTR